MNVSLLFTERGHSDVTADVVSCLIPTGICDGANALIYECCWPFPLPCFREYFGFVRSVSFPHPTCKDSSAFADFFFFFFWILWMTSWGERERDGKPRRICELRLGEGLFKEFLEERSAWRGHEAWKKHKENKMVLRNITVGYNLLPKVWEILIRDCFILKSQLVVGISSMDAGTTRRLEAVDPCFIGEIWGGYQVGWWTLSAALLPWARLTSLQIWAESTVSLWQLDQQHRWPWNIGTGAKLKTWSTKSCKLRDNVLVCIH